MVLCDECQCEGPVGKSAHDAIAAWNRRSAQGSNEAFAAQKPE